MTPARNVSGRDLAKALRREFGYEVTRQRGSHMRLTGDRAGVACHITIPDHDPLKTGTLNGILALVVEQMELEKKEVIRRVIG